jgi:hypothetical protein
MTTDKIGFSNSSFRTEENEQLVMRIGFFLNPDKNREIGGSFNNPGDNSINPDIPVC